MNVSEKNDKTCCILEPIFIDFAFVTVLFFLTAYDYNQSLSLPIAWALKLVMAVHQSHTFDIITVTQESM